MNIRQNVKLRPVQGLTQYHLNSFGLIYMDGNVWSLLTQVDLNLRELNQLLKREDEIIS